MKALLWLKWMRWRWMLTEARRFRSNLERTIENERVRAERAVRHAELMERRAEIALIAARADRVQLSRKST